MKYSSPEINTEALSSHQYDSGINFLGRESLKTDYFPLFQKHIPKPNIPKALELAKKSAEKGNPVGQTTLGYLYAKGEHIEQDYEEARRLFQLAVDQGYYEAQIYLGILYFEGKGGDRDAIQARDLFQLAADQGSADAQFYLGMMYFDGTDIKQDYKKSRELLQLAVEQQYALAQLSLGYFYSEGFGEPKNKKKGNELLELAAKQGLHLDDEGLEEYVKELEKTGNKYRNVQQKPEKGLVDLQVVLENLEKLPKEKQQAILEQFQKSVNAALADLENPPYEPPPLPTEAPELWQGKKKSGDAIKFLGDVYGGWLVHFTPELSKNYLSTAQLKVLDLKLYEGVKSAIRMAKRANRPLVSEEIEITTLGQLFERELSDSEIAEYWRVKKQKSRNNTPLPPEK